MDTYLELAYSSSYLDFVVSLDLSTSKSRHLAPEDLPFFRYIWDIAKSTTKAERVSCVVAIVLLLICILLIVYFTVLAKSETDIADVAPHDWFITREMWLATEYKDVEETEPYNPLKLVIVSHTVSSECDVFINCAAEMRTLQSYFLNNKHYDIPYNFLIANDGRVYEGRGWNIVGAHTYRYNRCSLGLAFVGDYREGQPSYSKVTKLQEERAQMLLEVGVKLGHLHPQFRVVGACDITSTLSPGPNLYKAIQKWPNYDHNHLYKNRTCDQIQELLSTTSAPTTHF